MLSRLEAKDPKALASRLSKRQKGELVTRYKRRLRQREILRKWKYESKCGDLKTLTITNKMYIFMP